MAAQPKTEARRIQGTLDYIVRFGLALPEVVESTSYGQPALKRGDKLIFALRKDLETLALVCGFEERAALMKEDPEAFFITDHYLGYPSVVVRLRAVKRAVLRRVVKAAWERIGAVRPKNRRSQGSPPAARRV